jgi:8-oxo-dGTP diphosphatase
VDGRHAATPIDDSAKDLDPGEESVGIPAVKMIHVAAGAIADSLGRILITRRPENVHQGGLWEFPGGKLELGETAEEGLSRELHEELGIRVQESRPLIRIHHDYGDRHVLLDVHRVSAFTGKPHGREGQPLAWIRPDDMDPRTFPAADRPIIAALRLPALYLVTGDDPGDPRGFLERLRRSLASGIRLVQLRAHALSDAEYGYLARAAFGICERHGARLLLNRDAALARELPSHGLHLTSTRLAQLDRRPLDDGYLVGASCHGAGELGHAADLGLDYALLSPVQATATHPQANPLGWGQFSALADPALLPVYALGGLGPDDLKLAHRHGAQGIAAIRGLWANSPKQSS